MFAYHFYYLNTIKKKRNEAEQLKNRKLSEIHKFQHTKFLNIYIDEFVSKRKYDYKKVAMILQLTSNDTSLMYTSNECDVDSFSGKIDDLLNLIMELEFISKTSFRINYIANNNCIENHRTLTLSKKIMRIFLWISSAFLLEAFRLSENVLI